MKKCITFYCIALVWLLSNIAQAQQWTFGPKVRLPTSQNVDLVPVTVGPLSLNLGGINESKPSQWAAFARYDRSRFFAQTEAFIGRFDVNSTLSHIPSRVVGINLITGVKPLPWLRLYGGGSYQRHNWKNIRFGKFGELADGAERALEGGNVPASDIDAVNRQIQQFRLLDLISSAYQKHVLAGQVGLGVDIGGLTVDLAYNHSLTPLLRDIPTANGTLNARQGYNGYILSLGYRLLPVKAFLAAPRKRNPAYQRLKRDIPFYRNEFHVAGGLIGEDIGSAFTYENRYTRYITRRFGVVGGLNVMRVFNTFDADYSYGLPAHYNAFQLVTGLRVLPLYSRRHVIGITAGPTMTLETGVSAYSGGSNTGAGGGRYQYVNWRADSRQQGIALDWMAMMDYQFAATDRIVIGPWLRINGIDFAALGIQAGYRF